MSTLSHGKELLEEIIKEPATDHVASMLHYLVIHANVKQYYYELKYVRNEQRLIELIGRALREVDMIKGSEDHRDNLAKLLLPSKEDLAKVLELYRKFGKSFTASLAAMTVATCKLCWTERSR
jgi:hypothetical protein